MDDINKDCWLIDRCKRNHCNDAIGCLILRKLNYLYDEANIPLNLRRNKILRAEADGTDVNEFKLLKQIADNIVEFVQNGSQLYIFSNNTGNGKTSSALKLIQSYFNKIWLSTPLKCRGLFINVPYFLLSLKDNISDKSDYIQHIKENILDADIVIWDDIATKSTTSFESENLLSMIDARININKCNIFTSNLGPEELHRYLGDRLFSRIYNKADNIIELKGGDKRGLKLN